MNKSKVYVYKSNDKYYTDVYTGKYDGWDVWVENNKQKFILYEDSKGLYYGGIESEYFTDIQYPVQVNKKWNNGMELGIRCK